METPPASAPVPAGALCPTCPRLSRARSSRPRSPAPPCPRPPRPPQSPLPASSSTTKLASSSALTTPAPRLLCLTILLHGWDARVSARGCSTQRAANLSPRSLCRHRRVVATSATAPPSTPSLTRSSARPWKTHSLKRRALHKRSRTWSSRQTMKSDDCRGESGPDCPVRTDEKDGSGSAKGVPVMSFGFSLFRRECIPAWILRWLQRGVGTVDSSA
ncbi:hypothetical protein B0H10DRAFT_633125 [Mycena sp. CBHHK59/15]|nr:hypothetical protein B0H10DRAFT_633125 [Mycena sp. CBHHK59/15]